MGWPKGVPRKYKPSPMILFETANSVGGACANIVGKSREQIIHIRDWCNWLLAGDQPNAL